MKSKKSSGKGKQAGQRGIKDLPVSDAKAKNTKGGAFPNSVGTAIGDVAKAVATAAQKV